MEAAKCWDAAPLSGSVKAHRETEIPRPRLGREYAFDLVLFGKAPVKPKLKEVSAFVTTVPGYSAVDSPPGCS